MGANDGMRELIIDGTSRLLRNIHEAAPDAPGFSRSEWDALSAGGFTAVQNEGLALADAIFMLYNAGYWAVAAPWAENIIATCLIQLADFSLSEGIYTVAIENHQECPAVISDGRLTIQGKWSGVPWAREATSIVLHLKDGVSPGGVVACIPRGSWRVECYRDLAGNPLDTVSFAEASSVDCVRVSREPLWTHSIMALTRVFEAMGATDRIVEMTVEYAKTRTQFGRPLASFQLVQSKLAEMAAEAAALRAIGQRAMQVLDEGGGEGELVKYVAVASIRLSQAVPIVTTHAHQVLGAIGFTEDYPLHRYTRRLWAHRHAGLSASAWMKAIARRMESQELWDFVTE